MTEYIDINCLKKEKSCSAEMSALY